MEVHKEFLQKRGKDFQRNSEKAQCIIESMIRIWAGIPHPQKKETKGNNTVFNLIFRKVVKATKEGK